MAANEIKIIVGGDATPLINASQQSVAAVNDLQKTIVTASVKIDAATDSIRHSFDDVAAGKAAMDRIAESINAAADAATKAGPKFDSLGGRLPLQEVSKFSNAINELKKDLASGFKVQVINPNFIPPSIPPTLEKVKTSSKQAGAAVLDFSRIVQDAPYAANNFGSIANNIDPAVQSYTRLTEEAKRLSIETGKNVSTFSLLKQSLMGGAGIGLAISAVTSLITVAQMKYGSLGNAIDALVGNLSSAEIAQRSLSKSFAEAEGRVAGETANINALLSIARNETLSKQARGEAINKLNKEYDAYLPKLSLENIGTKEVTEAVDKLTLSLLRQAKIKGLQDLISKETAKQADLLSNSLGDNASAWDNVVAAVKSIGPGTNFFIEKQIAGAKATGEGYLEAQKKIDLFNKSLKELTKDEAVAGTLFDDTKVKKEQDFLKKRLEALEKIKLSLKDAAQLVGVQESIFDLQVKIAIRDQGKNRLSNQEVQQQIKGFQDELNEAFKRQAIELEAIPKVKFSDVVLADISFKEVESKIAKATGLDKKIVIPTQYDIDLRFNGKEFAENAERVRQQVKGVADALFNGIVSGITEGSALLGKAFGDILSGEGITNGLAKAAEGLLGIIGSILQDVGRQIIITSVLVAALKKAINSLFGPGGEAIALAVGVGLIATGAVLKNIKFDVPKLAQGGIATSATLGIFGEAGKEAIIPLDKLPEMLGRINVGNQQPIVLNGNMRVSGQDLTFLLERATSQRRRLG